MRLKREIPLRVGGLEIDLICKLAVVLSTNRNVEKAISWFVSLSMVNWIDGLTLFRWSCRVCTRPDLIPAHTSSTYRFQNWGWTREVDKACCSKFSMTRLAITADTGEPIATSGRPNGNSILGSENTKKQSIKNIPRNLHSPNIVYNLVTLSRGVRLQYYVLTKAGKTDAS